MEQLVRAKVSLTSKQVWRPVAAGVTVAQRVAAVKAQWELMEQWDSQQKIEWMVGDQRLKNVVDSDWKNGLARRWRLMHRSYNGVLKDRSLTSEQRVQFMSRIWKLMIGTVSNKPCLLDLAIEKPNLDVLQAALEASRQLPYLLNQNVLVQDLIEERWSEQSDLVDQAVRLVDEVQRTWMEYLPSDKLEWKE